MVAPSERQSPRIMGKAGLGVSRFTGWPALPSPERIAALRDAQRKLESVAGVTIFVAKVLDHAVGLEEGAYLLQGGGNGWAAFAVRVTVV
jgi:hypothetical protein